jgi:predicted lipoprotein with Yx(FWY)xxD motif
MKLSTLLLGAAAIGLLSTSLTFAADYLGGAVKSATVGGKEILTDSKGMTLYIWDKDAVGVSNCYEQCAVNWPPMWVPAGTAVEGEFTLVDRTDATGDHADMKIVAYKGWPLYLWIKDKAPGDTTGDGVGGTWHTAVEAM